MDWRMGLRMKKRWIVERSLGRKKEERVERIVCGGDLRKRRRPF